MPLMEAELSRHKDATNIRSIASNLIAGKLRSSIKAATDQQSTCQGTRRGARSYTIVHTGTLPPTTFALCKECCA